ncbi:acyl-CoA dehydrogenase [Myxococcota bacterium]
MHLDLTEEQIMLRDTCRAFAREELLPRAAEIDERGEFPREQVQRMAELGLMGVAVEADYEGAGMDNVAYALAMEEISAGCASCGVIMSVNNSLVCDPILKFGTEEQKKMWLPSLSTGRKLGCFALSEPGTGSDAAAQKATAVKDGRDWILNGSKNFITNGNDADLCIVFAMGDKAKGVKGINAYLVPSDAKGYSVAKNEKKLGIKASSTSQINLDDVRVGPEGLLGAEGQGFKVAMTTLDGGRIGIAAQALGIARQALAEARDYALERNAFGGPIANLQAIQFMLADMATEVDAARLLIWRAAVLKDKSARYSTESAMAKLFASEMSNRVTNKALQIFGGYGYCKDYPAERHLRDARITEIYEGTSEIQRLVVARAVLTGR